MACFRLGERITPIPSLDKFGVKPSGRGALMVHTIEDVPPGMRKIVAHAQWLTVERKRRGRIEVFAREWDRDGNAIHKWVPESQAFLLERYSGAWFLRGRKNVQQKGTNLRNALRIA